MGINKQRAIDNINSFKHGKYGAYGDRDLITFQAKLERHLVNDFESIRRKEV